jgi:hypothetical protein
MRLTQLHAKKGLTASAAFALLSLLLSAALAQQPETAPVTPEPPAQTTPAAPPAAVAPPRKPGFMESIGRWVDESVSGVSKGFEDAVRNATKKSAPAPAPGASAATAPTDFGKGAVDAARGTFDAAKGTFDALGRLGGARVETGREKCALASNGAPDCRAASEALCKAKGYTGGSSLEFETVENCPPQVLLSGRRPPGACTTEHVVTKAMCQ